MTIEERLYIERMEGYEEGYKIRYAEGLEIGRKEGRTKARVRYEKRLRELGCLEEIIKAALSEQAEQADQPNRP